MARHTGAKPSPSRRAQSAMSSGRRPRLGCSLVASLVIFSHAALPFLSWVLTAFIPGYIETLSLREAPSLCLLSIKVNSLWQSLGLLASSSPPSLATGTNGSYGLLPPPSLLQPHWLLPARPRPRRRPKPPRRLPAPTPPT